MYKENIKVKKYLLAVIPAGIGHTHRVGHNTIPAFYLHIGQIVHPP
jgi:hypothetical protein